MFGKNGFADPNKYQTVFSRLIDKSWVHCLFEQGRGQCVKGFPGGLSVNNKLRPEPISLGIRDPMCHDFRKCLVLGSGYWKTWENGAFRQPTIWEAIGKQIKRCVGFSGLLYGFIMLLWCNYSKMANSGFWTYSNIFRNVFGTKCSPNLACIFR